MPQLPGHFQIAATVGRGVMVVLLGTASTAGQSPTTRPSEPSAAVWQSVGQISHEPISECSGIVASRRYEGIFWVHNDSGHPPVLYAIRESGGTGG